jgi:hypothetical protein
MKNEKLRVPRDFTDLIITPALCENGPNYPGFSLPYAPNHEENTSFEVIH